MRDIMSNSGAFTSRKISRASGADDDINTSIWTTIRINKILEEIEVFEEGIPFARLNAKELYDSILFYLDEKDPEDSDAGIVTDILDILESKIEKEDPLILLITDY